MREMNPGLLVKCELFDSMNGGYTNKQKGHGDRLALCEQAGKTTLRKKWRRESVNPYIHPIERQKG